MYKCLVIEDEPLAQQVLKKYIADHPMLQLTGICNDAMEAQQLLASEKIAILFLDINLPKLSGIHFLRSLPDPPAVISRPLTQNLPWKVLISTLSII